MSFHELAKYSFCLCFSVFPWLLHPHPLSQLDFFQCSSISVPDVFLFHLLPIANFLLCSQVAFCSYQGGGHLASKIIVYDGSRKINLTGSVKLCKARAEAWADVPLLPPLGRYVSRVRLSWGLSAVSWGK